MSTAQRLPGMEDARIDELHEAALEYAAIRDKRMSLTEQEAGLKAKLLGLLKEYGKDVYEFNGVKVERIMEEETVKVRIRRHKDDDADEPAPDVEAAAAIVEEMQEPEPERKDPLEEEGAFINQRNRGRRRKAL